MSFNGIDKLRPVGGYQPRPGPARAKPPPKDPSGIRGREITGVIFDDLECRGCGATLSHAEPACTYCKRPNPFALARQAAKAIEITQLDDYVPRFIFDGTLTTEEAREFASMWMSEQSRPGAIIPLPAGMEFAGMQRLQIEPIEPARRDGAYALTPLGIGPTNRDLPGVARALDEWQAERTAAKTSLLSRLITRLFR